LIGCSCALSLTRRDWYKITARLNLLRLHTSKLLPGVDTEYENRFHYLDSGEFKNPEQVAKLMRKYWKIPAGPISNLIGEIENAGGIVYLLRFGTDKIDAISQSAPGLPPLFLVNSEIPGDRCRFTLAHELGHIIMHGRCPAENMEEEADRFAAEFLMPKADIADDLESITLTKAASVLKPYWKVSIAALIVRAKELGKITASQYKNLFTQLSYHGYRKHEPVEIPPEQPTVLNDIMTVYLSDYGYDLAALSKFLNLFEDELTKEYIPSEVRSAHLKAI
jgi:Zn-dependent peptidase ImmA (M78 family)